MAHVTADRVRDTSTTTGTGAFSVSGTAPTGYRTFSAVLTTSDTCWYAIQHQTAAEWEVGLGTYSSADTITRTTVVASSNANSAVNFSAGTKDIFITLPASKTVQLDASNNASALGVVASATLTNATGLPVSTGISGLGSNVATFLATPNSANLASAVTDETGSGSLVFGTSPSFTTSALFPDGSSSAPSIGHSGDTNTGFFFPAADTIAAATAGAETLRITSAGNVGIGTTSLSTVSFRVTKNITGSTTAYLSRYDGTVQPDVTGAAYGSTVINGTAANGGTPYTISSLYAYQASQGTFNADSTVTNQYTFSVNANSIGATNNYGFHIANTAAVTTGKTSYGFYSAINTATGGGTTYQLYMAGTSTSFINGSLGIGTNAPGQKLTVVGTVESTSGGFKFPDATTQTTASSPADFQSFTSSGTWTKPSGYGADSRVHIQAWGGGGGGFKGTSAGSGGGGGGYNERWLTLSSMGATETITIGAGGTGGTTPTIGGNTTVGSLVTAYGGSQGANSLGGGGGGQLSAGTTTTAGTGLVIAAGTTLPGRPRIISDLTAADALCWQGGGQTSSGAANANAAYMHGGGGGMSTFAGGETVWGGAGGGGFNAGAAGSSKYGGNGGAGSSAGTAGNGVQPGGGGGGTSTGTAGSGAAGQVWITVYPAV